MARKPSMIVQADLDELAFTVGALSEMAVYVDSDKFISTLIESSHQRLSNRFDASMDLKFPTMPGKFFHVYEWNATPGSPEARLWKHSLKGRGRNRVVAWDWKVSKMPLMKPDERSALPKGHPRYLPSSVTQFMSDKDYFFRWKAPMMEYNTPITVTTKSAKKLVVPVPSRTNGYALLDEANIANPGGKETTGAFTSEWVTWWNTVAPSIIKEEVDKEVERDIDKTMEKVLVKGKRKATISLSAQSDVAKAMRKGRQWAKRELPSVATKMQRSAEREQ